MPKAEVGSTKYISNQMKSKGLNRLRWFCQLCTKSCRDENGYKMHCQSESHMRKALEAGQNFKGVQEDFSKAFLSEFVSLLKTGHGEKQINANRFYQEVISKPDHVHLNATRWHSLTEFVKSLGRDGICRVEEKEDGLFIAWINDDPAAIRRRDEARRKDMQDKGDEEREQMMLREQIKRAQKDAASRGVVLEEEEEDTSHELKRQEGEKIKLSFGAAKTAPAPTPTTTGTSPNAASPSTTGQELKGDETSDSAPATGGAPSAETTQGDKPKEAEPTAPGAMKPVSMKFGAKPQPKNVFKNAFAGAPKKVMAVPPKKMSEAERIMKEELERKRARESSGGPPAKKMKFQF